MHTALDHAQDKLYEMKIGVARENVSLDVILKVLKRKGGLCIGEGERVINRHRKKERECVC